MHAIRTCPTQYQRRWILSGVYPYKYFGKAEDKRTDFSTAMKVEQPAEALAYLVNIDDDLVINSFEMQS